MRIKKCLNSRADSHGTVDVQNNLCRCLRENRGFIDAYERSVTFAALHNNVYLISARLGGYWKSPRQLPFHYRNFI